MRIIFNIHSKRAARAAGWRARAVNVNDKSKCDVKQVLKSVRLADGSTMYDYIIEGNSLRAEWALFVNGIGVSNSSDLKKEVMDNVQIHLMSVY